MPLPPAPQYLHAALSHRHNPTAPDRLRQLRPKRELHSGLLDLSSNNTSSFARSSRRSGNAASVVDPDDGGRACCFATRSSRNHVLHRRQCSITPHTSRPLATAPDSWRLAAACDQSRAHYTPSIAHMNVIDMVTSPEPCTRSSWCCCQIALGDRSNQ